MSTAIEKLKEANAARDAAIIAANRETTAKLRAAMPIVRPAPAEALAIEPPSEMEAELAAQLAAIEQTLAAIGENVNVRRDLLERRRTRLRHEREELEAERRARHTIALGASLAAARAKIDVVRVRSVPQPGDRTLLHLGNESGNVLIDGRQMFYDYPLAFVRPDELAVHEAAIAADEQRRAANAFGPGRDAPAEQVRFLVVVPEGLNLAQVMAMARTSDHRPMSVAFDDRRWLSQATPEAIAFLGGEVK